MWSERPSRRRPSIAELPKRVRPSPTFPATLPRRRCGPSPDDQFPWSGNRTVCDQEWPGRGRSYPVSSLNMRERQAVKPGVIRPWGEIAFLPGCRGGGIPSCASPAPADPLHDARDYCLRRPCCRRRDDGNRRYLIPDHVGRVCGGDVGAASRTAPGTGRSGVARGVVEPRFCRHPRGSDGHRRLWPAEPGLDPVLHRCW